MASVVASTSSRSPNVQATYAAKESIIVWRASDRRDSVPAGLKGRCIGAREKCRRLYFVPLNFAWPIGDVVAAFPEPFDRLAETTAIAARSNVSSNANFSKNEIWLRE